MAIIGIDIHRSFAQAAFLQDGQVKREQRIDLVPDRLVRFGKSLSVEDEVVIEATGNSAAVERSCDRSSSAWSWRIREWFGRSPMPGFRRTRSTRSYWPDFTPAASYRRSGLRTTTPTPAAADG